MRALSRRLAKRTGLLGCGLLHGFLSVPDPVPSGEQKRVANGLWPARGWAWPARGCSELSGASGDDGRESRGYAWGPGDARAERTHGDGSAGAQPDARGCRRPWVWGRRERATSLPLDQPPGPHRPRPRRLPGAHALRAVPAAGAPPGSAREAGRPEAAWTAPRTQVRPPRERKLRAGRVETRSRGAQRASGAGSRVITPAARPSGGSPRPRSVPPCRSSRGQFAN